MQLNQYILRRAQFLHFRGLNQKYMIYEIFIGIFTVLNGFQCACIVNETYLYFHGFASLRQPAFFVCMSLLEFIASESKLNFSSMVIKIF